jgi:hypothetical protein
MWQSYRVLKLSRNASEWQSVSTKRRSDVVAVQGPQAPKPPAGANREAKFRDFLERSRRFIQ